MFSKAKITDFYCTMDDFCKEFTGMQKNMRQKADFM